MEPYRRVASPILAMFSLQIAISLINAFLPLSLNESGALFFVVGLVGAAYGAGFMLGAFYATRFIRRVGHVRAFAGAASLGTAMTLALIWGHSEAFTAGVVRLVSGACVAVLFTSAESWINDSARPQTRGKIISFYMVLTKAALAIGPFLPLIAGPSPLDAFAVAGIFFALSLLPMTATSQEEPAAPTTDPLGLKRLWEIAPAALIATFVAGLFNTGTMWHAPLFAKELSFGPEQAPVAAAFFLAAAWLGSFVVQWPAGALSDRMDRRSVIAALAGASALASGLLFFIGISHGPFWPALIVFFVWGAGALSFYGVSVAHAADRADRRQMPQVIAGLLFVWAIGSIAGPILFGLAAQIPPFKLSNIFLFAALGYGGLAFTMVIRAAQRPPLETDNKEPFIATSTTSIAMAEADPRGEPAATSPVNPNVSVPGTVAGPAPPPNAVKPI